MTSIEIIEEEEKLQNFGPTVKIWIILWTGLGSNLNFRHKAQAHFLVQATVIENFLPVEIILLYKYARLLLLENSKFFLVRTLINPLLCWQLQPQIISSVTHYSNFRFYDSQILEYLTQCHFNQRRDMLDEMSNRDSIIRPLDGLHCFPVSQKMVSSMIWIVSGLRYHA